MLLSSGYHLFFCHSEKACKRWLAMDLAGISIGLIGCYLPSIQLAFYCHQVTAAYTFTFYRSMEVGVRPVSQI